jgi:hypothetical protein
MPACAGMTKIRRLCRNWLVNKNAEAYQRDKTLQTGLSI